GPRAGRCVRALRRVSRAVPAWRAIDRGRRGTAAPAGRTVRGQVLLRATIPLPAHRSARSDPRRPGTVLSGRAGGRRVRAEGPRPAVREVGRVSVLRPG